MKQLPNEATSRDHHAHHDLFSPMMTINRPQEDWGKLIGNAQAASAIRLSFPVGRATCFLSWICG